MMHGQKNIKVVTLRHAFCSPAKGESVFSVT